MSDTAAHKPESDDEAGRTLPGEWLREKRESLGWPLEQVGQELRILPSVLRALEENRFEVLEAPIFVRGHLRNYARLLGLSPEEVLEAYEASRPSETDPSLKVSGASGPAMESRTPAWVVPFAWLVLLTMLVLGGLYWYVGPTRESLMAGGGAGDDSVEPSVEETSPEPEVETASSLAAREAENTVGADSSGEDEITVPPSLDPLAAGGETESSDASRSTDLAEDATSAENTSSVSTDDGGVATDEGPVMVDRNEADAVSAGESSDETPVESNGGAEPDPGPVPEAGTPGVRSLTLRLSDDSWLEIYDDRDRQLYYGLAGAGEEVNLRGEAPISLFMGNAPAVALEVDGEVHDFSARIRRDNTARITVYAADEEAGGDPSGD